MLVPVHVQSTEVSFSADVFLLLACTYNYYTSCTIVCSTGKIYHTLVLVHTQSAELYRCLLYRQPRIIVSLYIFLHRKVESLNTKPAKTVQAANEGVLIQTVDYNRSDHSIGPG